MGNLRSKYTDEEWEELTQSLIGKKKNCDIKIKSYWAVEKDEIVKDVINKFSERSRIGIAKYNTTLQRNNLSLTEWLNHLQEELMDATLYIEKLKQEIK